MRICKKNNYFYSTRIIFSIFFIVFFIIFNPTKIFAEELEKELTIQEAGLLGFGQLVGQSGGQFYVPVSGPTKSTGGITIKALNCPQGAYIVATIYRPDGSILSMSVPNGISFIQLTPGDSDYLNRYQFKNATAGNYRVYFESTDNVDILCWIYG